MPTPTFEDRWQLLSTPIYVASPDGSWAPAGPLAPPPVGARMRYEHVDDKAGPVWLMEIPGAPPTYSEEEWTKVNHWISTNQVKHLSHR